MRKGAPSRVTMATADLEFAGVAQATAVERQVEGRYVGALETIWRALFYKQNRRIIKKPAVL